MSPLNVSKIIDFLKALTKILPLLEMLIPGIREKIDALRDGIEREGAEFINRNLPAFRALVIIGNTLMNVGSALKLIGTMAPQYAADNDLDLTELESLGRMLGMGEDGLDELQRIDQAVNVLKAIK